MCFCLVYSGPTHNIALFFEFACLRLVSICCQFLWIIHFWLLLRYSLPFIVKMTLYWTSLCFVLSYFICLFVCFYFVFCFWLFFFGEWCWPDLLFYFFGCCFVVFISVKFVLMGYNLLRLYSTKFPLYNKNKVKSF
jgi:hypothetical protein